MKNIIRGFTLIELMSVVAIIGILVALAAPSFNAAVRRRAVNTLARKVASTVYQARSAAQIKQKTMMVQFTPGNFYIAFRDGTNYTPKGTTESGYDYDPTVTITTRDKSRVYINQNGQIIDGNGHPIDSIDITITDTLSGDVIALTVNHAGSIDWS